MPPARRRLKLPADYRIPPHWHPAVERVTVLQLHGSGPWGITYLNPADDPREK